MENPYNIPFDELNDYYFSQFIPALPVSLQPLATNRQVIHHTPEETHIKSLHELTFRSHHMYVPYVLNDIFDVPSDSLTQIGRAWLLTILDLILIDHMVDGQLPSINTIGLFQNYLRSQAAEIFHNVFGGASDFWAVYYDEQRQFWAGMARESAALDHYHEAYTMDVFNAVGIGKTAQYRMILFALGKLSKPDLIKPLQRVYDNLSLVDLLLDDAGDWEEDMLEGRRTLPVVMTMQAQDIPLDDFQSLDTKTIDRWISQHGILVQMVDLSLKLLDEALKELEKIGHANSKIGQVIHKRKSDAEELHQHFTELRGYKLTLYVLESLKLRS